MASSTAAFGASATPKPDAPSTSATAQAEKEKPKTPPGWPVLKTGASAEEVIKLVGKPDVVKPMATKEGKAEIWIYRRLAKEFTRQTAAATEDLKTFGTDGMTTISVPSQKMEYISVYQVSSLLMFNGQLVTAAQKAETERHFQ